jgi:SAM-dependent methyltransferase
MARPSSEEWTDPEHVSAYLANADRFPHRSEGDAVLVEHLPAQPRRILDVGCGDGRLLAMVLAARPGSTGVALDFSPVMLEAVRARFAGDERVGIVGHDLSRPLPDGLGSFDAVVSSFAIHHLEDDRKRALYGEILELLEPGGVFANLEHVASPSRRLHEAFFAAIGEPIENEDPSDRTVDAWIQAGWLSELGFEDADCYWKWLEMALLIGRKAERPDRLASQAE